jgi:two-component system LytT family response regulator
MTHLYFKNKNKITACRTLKEVEEQLEDFNFFIRVHQSHIVNLNEIIRYMHGDGGYLILSDGTSVNVSRSRKEMLLKTLRPDKC